MFLKTKKISSPAKSLHQCFHLIYFLLYHTGCLGCKIKTENELYYDRRYNIYRNVYRLIYLTGLIGGFVYKIIDEELNEAFMGQLPPVIKVILTFESIVCPATYVVVTLYLDWYREKYIYLANSMQTLDKQMQKRFKNIDWNYKKSTRKYTSMTVGLYGFYAIVSTIYIFNIAHCSCGWISSTMISICYACVTGAPAFAGFLFIGNMDMLRIRFRLISKLLQQHSSLKRGKHLLIQFENIPKIKLLQNYFMEYSSLIVPLNQVFLISALGLFHDFAIITSMGYLLCSKALDTKAKAHEYVLISLFVLPRIYKVVNTAVYGYTTQKERRNCCREFIKIGYYFKESSIMQQHTELFLYWSMHNNYRVTVGKVLNCSLSLIFLTLNGIVNYIMILLQLQFQQNNIANRVKYGINK